MDSELKCSTKANTNAVEDIRHYVAQLNAVKLSPAMGTSEYTTSVPGEGVDLLTTIRGMCRESVSILFVVFRPCTI